MSCFEKCSNAGMNLELERKKEFERRKKLRLLQVRQQSKEFADQLRGRIRGEIIKQKTKYLEAENKLKQEEHLKELRHLKELYDKCLQSIGNGHKEASKQPDINLEKQTQLDRIVEQAAKRGTKAIKKQIEDKTIQKQTREAPVKQKKVIRNKENLRAFFISSLPKNSKKDDSISPPKTSHQNTETLQVRRVLEDIPSNINNGNSKAPEQSRKNVESVSVLKTVSKVGEKVQSREQGLPETVVTETKPADCTSVVSSPRDCSCDYIVCLCHQSPPDLRRSSSESRLSCDRVPVFDDPVKKKYRRRSSSPQSVRTLKYFGCGNVYESNQRSSVRVTHHSRSPKRTEEQSEKVKSSTVAEVPIEQSIEELKKRAEERSAKALKKEQLKKDFQQLINNLKKLSQEKSVISSKTKGKSRVFASERDIQSRNEKKQKKLNDAFEKLPHSLKSNKAQNSGTEKQKPNQVPSDESSPPTLNLALCQSNMSPPASRRVVSEISISDTSSAYSGGSKRMKKRAKSSSSSTRLRAESPEVLVKRDPSGDVHITVKVSEVLSRPKSKSPSPPSRRRHISPRSDSSYMSPPSNLTPSQQHLLNALLSQVNKRGIGDEMRKYIKKLLNMSRESIDNLHSQSRPQTPLNKDLEQDFAKLSQLAEVYAEKVNTLVDMYEQMGLPSPLSPAGYVDPIRAPPSEIQQRTPTPRSTRSASPTMRPMISPSVERFRTPSPTQRPKMTSPSPSSSGYRLTQPHYTPSSPGPLWTPEQIQESVSRYHHPERPQTETPSYIPSMPIPASPWGSPHIPPVAPPGSRDSKIPIAVGRQPRPILSPSIPGPHSRADTPIKPSQHMMHHLGNKRQYKSRTQICPISDSPSTTKPQGKKTWQYGRSETNLQHTPPNLCPSSSGPSPFPGREQCTPPLRVENRRVRFPQDSERSVGGLNTINESPECANISANTADTMELMFGGIPGVQVPTREECAAMAQRSCSPGSTLPLPDDWDMQAWFSEKRQQILQQGTDCDRNSYSPDKRVQTGLPKSPERSAPQNPFSPGQNKSPVFSGFTQDFGEFAQDDFNNNFTDMDFNMGIDAVLQEEARGDDYVEYPEDFPPPTDVFGPGFDWETANFDQPNFPRSFPGESLAGHSMSSAGSVKLDTSFDTSALQGPVNPDRLNAIRKKLSNICNDQYRNILEMLKEDASSHQLAYGNLLRRATSDPFLDPNATLAPIGSPGKSYSGSEYTVPRHVSSPGSTRSGFEATGRTPPADKPVSDYGSPDWSSSFPSYLSSDPNTRSGGLNSFDTSPQYCDFNDVYSNLDNLMLLMKNHQERQ
ncbi:uncharacterized protein LOC128991441 isoform X1 [Macrosteles quadrilineatus]|uniref:uncharacterized protein LOC128991441 isoform X1 n=1 Tax=Macrosteles quadrilineatus TaxID=74068 RepID=UPI0023E2E373|nr:uncharacterized protein LOC128991441 isoform X1 [Macrosteles quadrilineatus]